MDIKPNKPNLRTRITRQQIIDTATQKASETGPFAEENKTSVEKLAHSMDAFEGDTLGQIQDNALGYSIGQVEKARNYRLGHKIGVGASLVGMGGHFAEALGVPMSGGLQLAAQALIIGGGLTAFGCAHFAVEHAANGTESINVVNKLHEWKGVIGTQESPPQE